MTLTLTCNANVPQVG